MLSTNIYSFLLNQIKICINRRTEYIVFRYNRRIPALLLIFYRIGWLSHYSFIVKQVRNKTRFLIKIAPLYFKHKTFYRHARLVTLPGRQYSLSLRAMKILKKCSGESIFILSTSKGMLTINEALLRGTGGLLVYYLI